MRHRLPLQEKDWELTRDQVAMVDAQWGPEAHRQAEEGIRQCFEPAGDLAKCDANSPLNVLNQAVAMVLSSAVRIVDLFGRKQWRARGMPCGSAAFPMMCTSSFDQAWSNHPFVFRRTWYVEHIGPYFEAMLGDPFFYGCNHNYTEKGYIDAEEIFGRALVPWAENGWTVAQFPDWTGSKMAGKPSAEAERARKLVVAANRDSRLAGLRRGFFNHREIMADPGNAEKHHQK